MTGHGNENHQCLKKTVGKDNKPRTTKPRRASEPRPTKTTVRVDADSEPKFSRLADVSTLNATWNAASREQPCAFVRGVTSPPFLTLLTFLAARPASKNSHRRVRMLRPVHGPEAIINDLTSLPRHYTPTEMRAAAARIDVIPRRRRARA